MASSKNLLQEYAQKHMYELPKYQTLSGNTDSNKPSWISMVKLWNGEMYMGDKKDTKVAAELDAASIALSAVLKANHKKVLREDFKDTLIILIDLENQPKALEQILSDFDFPEDRVEIHCFTSSHDIIAYESHDCVHIHRASSSLTDASDFALALWLGGRINKTLTRYLQVNPYTSVTGISTFAEYLDDQSNITYVIITKDHFGKVLQEICTKDEHRKAVVFPTATAFITAYTESQ